MTWTIDHLHISAFRGIKKDLDLDLSAPLTLLYAPNGTGKTSIFSALGWLLHGKDFDASAIRCIESPDELPTRVRATGLYSLDSGSAEPWTAVRDPSTTPFGDFGDYRYDETGYFEKLASPFDWTGAQSRGRARKAAYQEWIRSTRFLSADDVDLLRLNGSDAESKTLRERLWADLTSTSSLQAELVEARKFKGRVADTAKALLHQKQGLEAELERLTPLVEAGSTPGRRELVAEVFQLIHGSLPSETNVLDPDGLRTQLVRLNSDVESSLAKVAEADALLKAAAADAHTAATKSLSDILQDESVRLQRHLDAQLASHQEIKSASEQRAHTLRRIDKAIRQGEQATRAVRRLLEDRPALGSVRVRKEPAPEAPPATVDLGSLFSRCDYLVTLLDRVPDMLSLHRQMDSLRQSRNELLLQLAVEDISELKATSEEAASALTSAQSELASSQAQISQIKHLAGTWLRDVQKPVCPCCQQAWKDVESLRNAITSHPDMDPDDAKRLDKLKLEAEVAKANYAKAQTLLREEQGIRDGMSSDVEEARDFGIDFTGPAVLARAEEVLHSSLNHLIQRADTAMADFIPLSECSSIEQWQSTRSLSIVEMKKRSKQIAKEIEEHDEQETKASELIKECRQKLSVVSNRIRLSERLIKQLDISTITTESLTAVESHLTQRQVRFERAINLLNGVQRSDQANLARSQLQSLENDKGLLEEKLKVLQDREQSTEELIDWLEKEKTHRQEEGFTPIRNAVNQLYSHMQINRVVRSIEFKATPDGFDVAAELSDENPASLDPEKHFSQGQKQDLALSMFLARAATLGGSFFLDEPLRFLDDLNRTAVLDVLRAAVVATQGTERALRLTVTSANWQVTRHLIQKFRALEHARPAKSHTPLLRVYALQGNPRTGVRCEQIFPTAQTRGKSGPDGTNTPRQPTPERPPTLAVNVKEAVTARKMMSAVAK